MSRDHSSIDLASIDIGDVTAASGLPASTLHVWERHGLITPISRKSSRRQYEPGPVPSRV